MNSNNLNYCSQEMKQYLMYFLSTVNSFISKIKKNFYKILEIQVNQFDFYQTQSQGHNIDSFLFSCEKTLQDLRRIDCLFEGYVRNKCKLNICERLKIRHAGRGSQQSSSSSNNSRLCNYFIGPVTQCSNSDDMKFESLSLNSQNDGKNYYRMEEHLLADRNRGSFSLNMCQIQNQGSYTLNRLSSNSHNNQTEIIENMNFNMNCLSTVKFNPPQFTLRGQNQDRFNEVDSSDTETLQTEEKMWKSEAENEIETDRQKIKPRILSNNQPQSNNPNDNILLLDWTKPKARPTEFNSPKPLYNFRKKNKNTDCMELIDSIRRQLFG